MIHWMEQYIHCAMDEFILISRSTLRQDFTEFQSPAMAIMQVLLKHPHYVNKIILVNPIISGQVTL